MIKYGYIDRVDFEHELSEVSGGVKIFSSVDDIKRHISHIEECGIVKVKVELEEIVTPGAIYGSSYEPEEFDYQKEKIFLKNKIKEASDLLRGYEFQLAKLMTEYLEEKRSNRKET